MNIAEEKIAFFYEIGLTIAQWAHVERQLLQVTTLCVPPIDRIAIGEAFLSIENFRSKLAFANAAITRKFKGARLVAKWNKLEKKIKSASAMRNKLVHYPHMIFVDNAENRRFALIPWIPKSNGTIKRSKVSEAIKPPEGALCLEDIVSLRYQFHDLTILLSDLHEEISGRPKPLRASREPSQKHPKQRLGNSTIDQIRQALAKPDSPSR